MFVLVLVKVTFIVFVIKDVLRLANLFFVLDLLSFSFEYFHQNVSVDKVFKLAKAIQSTGESLLLIFFLFFCRIRFV
jgi:hypothetical protein